MSEFKWKWDKDDGIVTDSEFIEMMKEVNRNGCVVEPRYEERTNRAVLDYTFTGAWQDFFGILIHNGYEVTAKAVDADRVEITWKDKIDLVEEIKREAMKIEAERWNR